MRNAKKNITIKTEYNNWPFNLIYNEKNLLLTNIKENNNNKKQQTVREEVKQKQNRVHQEEGPIKIIGEKETQ